MGSPIVLKIFKFTNLICYNIVLDALYCMDNLQSLAHGDFRQKLYDVMEDYDELKEMREKWLNVCDRPAILKYHSKTPPVYPEWPHQPIMEPNETVPYGIKKNWVLFAFFNYVLSVNKFTI